MRKCPKCGSEEEEKNTVCSSCGLNLALLYMSYPKLAALIILGFRMVQAMEVSLYTPGFKSKIGFLGLSCLLGGTAYGLASHKEWGRWLALGTALPALAISFKALLGSQATGQTYRLFAESLYLLGFLLFTKD